MPTTSYTDPGVAWAAWALQARTNSSGTPLDDAGGEDARLAHEGFAAGVFGVDAFQVLQNSPAGMSVLVGSGSAKADVAQIQGTDAGQGFYRVRLGTGTTAVTITAADASNPRIDEIYLVVQDDTYDTSGNVVPRIGYRRGDAASSPSAPGPDAGWDAYLLIATIAVGASATSIVNANITDSRVTARVHDDGVATASIQGSAVSTAKIAADAVTQPKIGPSAVGTTEIADAAVTTTKLDGAAIAPFIVVRTNTRATNTGISGAAFEDVVTVTFTKPAAWNSYEITVDGMAVVESIGGVPTEYRVRAGANNGQTHSESSFPGEPAVLPVNERFSPSTASSHVCAVQVGNNGGATVTRAAVKFIAIRLT